MSLEYTILDLAKSNLVITYLIIFILLYAFVFDSKKNAMIAAFIPIAVMDYFISFGSYTFKFPEIIQWATGKSYTITHMTQTASLLDWVFNFGLWKSWGLQTFNAVSGTYVLSNMQRLLVQLYVWSDTIILFIVSAYILYYVLDKFEYAILGAGILTASYSYFISNPLKESATAQKIVEHAYYFMDHATEEQLIVVALSLLVSFAIIVFLLSLSAGLVMDIGKSTVRPGLESSIWEYSLTGLSFSIALAYSAIVLLHPSYSWYVVLPALIFYNMIQSSMRGHAEGRKEYNNQKRMVQEAMREYRN